VLPTRILSRVQSDDAISPLRSRPSTGSMSRARAGRPEVLPARAIAARRRESQVDAGRPGCCQRAGSTPSIPYPDQGRGTGEVSGPQVLPARGIAIPRSTRNRGLAIPRDYGGPRTTPLQALAYRIGTWLDRRSHRPAGCVFRVDRTQSPQRVQEILAGTHARSIGSEGSTGRGCSSRTTRRCFAERLEAHDAAPCSIS
jgi:hypothetical protein